MVGVVLPSTTTNWLLCSGCTRSRALIVENSLRALRICNKLVCRTVVLYVGLTFVAAPSSCRVVGSCLSPTIRTGPPCEVSWVVEIKCCVLSNRLRQSRTVSAPSLCVRQLSNLLMLTLRSLLSVTKQEKFTLCRRV